MGIWSKLLGSSEVIEKGMDLIDSMHTSDTEMMEAETEAKTEIIRAKTKSKTDLLLAYAPFKVAQRYLALMFGANFILSYWMVLIMYFMGREIDKVLEILAIFHIGWIMLLIVGFYFGGGAIEGVINKRKNK